MSRGDDARVEAEKRTRAELACQQLVDQQFTSVVPSGVDRTVQKVVALEESRQPAARATDRTRRFEVSGIDDLGDVHIFATDDPSVRAKCRHHGRGASRWS
jgi:hypothetical protein